MASLALVGVVASVAVLAQACADPGILDPKGIRPDAFATPLQVLPDWAGSLDGRWVWDGMPMNMTCAGHCTWTILLPVQGDAWLQWDGSASRGFVVGWQPSSHDLFDAQGAPPRFLTGATDGMQAASEGFDIAKVAVKGPGVLHAWGEGHVRLEMTGESPGLPNVVAIVPAHLGLPAPEAPGRPGCRPTEAGLHCLRFSAGLANLGDVPLELAATSVPAGDVAVPIVQGLPGGPIASGTAEYHAVHGHFHYTGLAALSLHPVVDGLRQPAAVTQGKAGFCTVDWGAVRDVGPLPPKVFWRDDCRLGGDLRMGISPNWYDLYRWYLPEQALDVAGLPRGTYDLVVDLDPGATLREATRLDNKAALRVEWDGEQATPLEAFGFLRLP